MDSHFEYSGDSSVSIPSVTVRHCTAHWASVRHYRSWSTLVSFCEQPYFRLYTFPIINPCSPPSYTLI